MAYKRKTTRRSSYRAKPRATKRYKTKRRTSRRSGTRAQKIIIQVVGAGGGVPVSAVTLGQKSARVMRAKY